MRKHTGEGPRGPQRPRIALVSLAAVGVIVLASGIAAARVVGERDREGAPASTSTSAPATTTAVATTTTAATAPTTAPTTTEAALPPPRVDFAGGFEEGGWKPFDDLQHEDDRPVGESFALVDDPVRQGQHAARIVVRQGYSRFGHNEDSEFVWKSDERSGDDYWYAWSTLFPPDWTAPWHWGIFAQWHANLGTSPILSFNAREDTAELNVHTGLTDEARNAFAFSRDIPLLDTLAKGRWNDFVLHVRWSTANDGLVEVFHRVAGEPSLQRLVTLRHIPTFQFTSDGKGVGTYALFGLYRASYCSQPTQLGCTGAEGVQAPNVLYQDGFTRARTFEDAVRYAFPGPAPKLPPVGGTPRAAAKLGRLEPDAVSTPAGRVVDPSCEGCAVTADAAGVHADIDGSEDDRDTATAVYLVKQRRTLVIRARLRVESTGPLTGNLVVDQLRDDRGRILAELYVLGEDTTLRVFSPPGALSKDGFNVSSGVKMPSGARRAVELRLTQKELVLGVGGKVRVRVPDLTGPAPGSQLRLRVGIDHYDGIPGEDSPSTDHDDLVVGAAS